LSEPRLRIEWPEAFEPLTQAARYKGAYGGRGGAKSHFFVEMALLRVYVAPTRIVCIREVQNSIRGGYVLLDFDMDINVHADQWIPRRHHRDVLASPALPGAPVGSQVTRASNDIAQMVE
jgi:hypothetical protein